VPSKHLCWLMTSNAGVSAITLPLLEKYPAAIFRTVAPFPPAKGCDACVARVGPRGATLGRGKRTVCATFAGCHFARAHYGPCPLPARSRSTATPRTPLMCSKDGTYG